MMLKYGEFFGKRIETLNAVFAHDQQILNSNTETTRQIDTRLTGKDIARFQRKGRDGRDKRRFMDIQTDSVP